MIIRSFLYGTILILIISALALPGDEKSDLDKQVRNFLESRKGKWHDMNVPESDGKLLYDLILENDYKKALEIGTSTGHSTIWIAWALSKTGGRLITIELDQARHNQARENIRLAGLSEFVDARLADAHELVKELPGPFDFIFSDADKGWYKNYFIDLYPKLEKNGCFAAHNVSGSSYGFGGTVEFYKYILTLPYLKTTVDKRGAGMSISYKQKKSGPE